MFRPFVTAAVLWVSVVPSCVRAEGSFENLGQPVRIRGLDIRLVTADPSGEHTAWGVVEDSDTVGLLGVRIPSGKLVRVDRLPFGRSHVQIARMKDGNLCIFTGVPGRFLKYEVDTEKLQQLGKPIGGCTYWLGSTIGPDGKIYVPSIPVKGRLGGALSRIDPQDFSVEVWRNLVPDQSIVGCAPVPETGELFCVSSVGGGSSAIPTQKEAVAFLWNARDEKIAWQGQPVPGQGTYGNVVRAENGTIYGIAGTRYYAFDPRQRKVLFVGDLPVKNVQFPGLRAQAVGPRKLLCARGDDALFAIDPSDQSVRVLARHPSLARAQGLCVLPDGTVYYGSGATLMRCRVSDP